MMNKMWIKLFILFSIACVVLSRECHKSSECGVDECCIEYLPYYKRCADKPDDVGDRCLGQFICDCREGLHCDLDPPSFYNVFKVGKGKCVSD